MKITYIITINPIISLDYLNLLVHTLNLQTSKRFDVIFYNQTRMSHDSIRSSLTKSIEFEHSFFDVAPEDFFGQYPVWNLYGTHQALLEQGRLNEYFMSLHMEEFLDPTYTECALRVLDETKLDILLGNLHATPFVYNDVTDLLRAGADRFQAALSARGAGSFVKWGMTDRPFFATRSWKTAVQRARTLKLLGWTKQLVPTESGFTLLDDYLLEDIFFMSTEFAKRLSWYGCPSPLYFEDIHINNALGELLPRATAFPAYLNSSKAYHLEHGKYYYQLEDAEFASKMLAFETDDEALQTLKVAIQLYRSDRGLTVSDALLMSRKSQGARGVSDISVAYHATILRTFADDKKACGARSAL